MKIDQLEQEFIDTLLFKYGELSYIKDSKVDYSDKREAERVMKLINEILFKVGL